MDVSRGLRRDELGVSGLLFEGMWFRGAPVHGMLVSVGSTAGEV